MRPTHAVLALGLLAVLPRAACAQRAAGLFDYDHTAALAVETGPAADSASFRLQRITYASPGGDRVTGLLAVPRSAGRHPAVILLHGMPGNAQHTMDLLGHGLARRGAVVLAINAPMVRRGELPDLTVRDSADQVQLMQDLQRAVDLLRARDDVDPGRIGYIGGSYGGAMGALFVGIEHRLRAAVLFVPDGGLVAHFTDSDGSPGGPLTGMPADERDRWLAAMRPIEPINFVGRSSPTPLLIQSALQDPLVARDDAEALQAAAGEPKTIRWYDSGHGLGSFPAAVADRDAFLERELGIPVE